MKATLRANLLQLRDHESCLLATSMGNRFEQLGTVARLAWSRQCGEAALGRGGGNYGSAKLPPSSVGCGGVSAGRQYVILRTLSPPLLPGLDLLLPMWRPTALAAFVRRVSAMPSLMGVWAML